MNLVTRLEFIPASLFDEIYHKVYISPFPRFIALGVMEPYVLVFLEKEFPSNINNTGVVMRGIRAL